MNHSSKDKHSYPKSSLQRQISNEIDLGIALSADPINADLPDLALRTTTMNSPWFARFCGFCQDKFRIGDQVRLCPRCDEAYHDDNQYSLDCWQRKFAHGAICKEGGPDRFSENGKVLPRCEFSASSFTASDLSLPLSEQLSSSPSPAALLVKQFINGIETTWRPFGDRQSIKIERASPLVGRKCQWCRFRVRVGDWVVKCPCQRNCGTYFHQDVFRHLTCWNEWNGVAGNNFCPTFGAPYPEITEDTSDGR